MTELAIIIPAFKKRYFSQALQSLANQTNKSFRVYIGDDKSPEDLKSLVDSFSDKLDIEYTRFEMNMGGTDLVGQWSRCVNLSKNEPWLWLFSDDDLLDPNCVENFYKVSGTDQGSSDVYRFNTVVIDGNGMLDWTPPEGPIKESSVLMAYHLLMGNRGNSIADHIFSRKIYEETGGFVNTNYAQAADWATSIRFSAAKGMQIIPNAKFYWRLSNTNMSSTSSGNRHKMLKGHLQFIEWVLIHFAYLKSEPSDGITAEMIRQAALYNLKSTVKNHYKGFDSSDFIILTEFLHRKFKLSYVQAAMEIYHLKLDTSASAKRLFMPVHHFMKKLGR